MKNLVTTLCLVLLSCTLLTAQNPKPKIRTKHASFIPMSSEEDPKNAKKVFKDLMKMTDKDDLRVEKVKKDPLGATHEVYQQYFEGVKVDGASMTVHAKKNKIYLLSGNYQDVFDVNVNPSIAEKSAFNAALSHVGGRRYIWDVERTPQPAGELVIYADPDLTKAARLAYKFDIYSVDPLFRAYVYIDAHSGAFLAENARIHETNSPATAATLYNGSRSITADFTGSNYRLRQTADGSGVETYSLNNGTNYNAATDITSPTSNFSSDPAANQAHWGAEQTHKYFLQTHNRNSFNGTGGVIRSYVHYSSNYVNAFWDGTRMTYGDGDGVNYGPLVSLDICGHEIAHGVTEYSANLVYQKESGALNESFSDIFGEAVEHFATGSNDWQMGTDIGIGGSGAIRSMNNPNAFGDPDTYGGANWINPNCTPSQFNDYCGVHTNSGVQNKWFYILSVGESGTNDLNNSYSVTGIGIDKAAAIAYRNLAIYLNSTSTYADARAGSIQAAEDIYGQGSPEVIATTNAWYAVGVGGEYGTISYCNSGGSNASYEWIANVTIGSFSNNSGSAGYTNFTAQTINLNAGQSYNLSLTPGFSGTVYNEYWKVWIDYNGDGDFSDAGELAFDAGSLSSSTVTGNITIPGSASGSTRLRVSMKWNAAQTECETFSYGEVEDYTVAFSAGAPDTQPPTAPANLVASNTTQTTTDLSWTASTDNVGVDHYNIFINGSPYGTSPTTSISVSGLSASTTYSIFVNAEDAAGNTSPASNTINVTTLSNSGPTTLLASYFETGWDGWSDGGSDCARYSGAASYEGNWSIQIRDNSGVASSMTSPVLDVSGFTDLEVNFYFYPNSMENGEDFWLRYYNGSTWQTVAAFVSGSSFTNGNFYVATVPVSSTNYAFPANAQFRFQCDASANSDQIYIDQVTITASGGSGLLAAGNDPVIRQVSSQAFFTAPPLPAFTGEETSVSLYPNPVSERLNIRLSGTVRQINVISVNGAVVQRITDIQDGDGSIDVSQLNPGIYFLSIQTGSEVIVERFIKQ